MVAAVVASGVKYLSELRENCQILKLSQAEGPFIDQYALFFFHATTTTTTRSLAL